MVLFHIFHVKGTVYITFCLFVCLSVYLFVFKCQLIKMRPLRCILGWWNGTLKALKEYFVDWGRGGQVGKMEPNLFH